MKKVNVIAIISIVCCLVLGITLLASAFLSRSWKKDFTVTELEPTFAWNEANENKYVQYSVTNNTDKVQCIKLYFTVEDHYYHYVGSVTSRVYEVAPGETIKPKVSYKYLAEKAGCKIEQLHSIQMKEIVYEK